MDLLETTLKVIENLSVVRENLSSYELNLKQCEEYINQLKESLQETQSENIQNLEILEINNLTKNAFNENCRLVKKLFGQVYDYAQEIENKLNKILQEENALNESFNENSERIQRLENTFINETKLLGILEKDVGDKVAKESLEIESTISNIKTEQKQYEELWRDVMDEFENKQKTLQTIKLETEMLQDKVDTENHQVETLAQENRKTNLNLFEEIKDEIIKKDRLLESETEEVLILSHKCKEIFKSKEEFIQKQADMRKTLELLNVKCMNTEVCLRATEAENKKRIELLHLDIDSKTKIINDKENELLACEEKIKTLNDEVEHITSKIAALENELHSLSGHANENEKKIAEEVNNPYNSQEIDSLTNKSMELRELLSKCEEEIREKENELNVIKTVPSLELSEIKSKMQQLELESAENIELKQAIEEKVLDNKNLQQAAESHQIALKEFEMKKIQLNADNELCQQEMKNLILQCDNIEKEIQRLEASKQKSIKITPTPPPKSLTPKRMPTPPKRKRKIDNESDSDVDGERLSYGEFMSKKTNNSKQK
nr:PREDICTED: uncharacterized protein PFB0765w isoform X2 [Tribolium castaneum]|eukprot:XP_015840371.1 PREDICTED: uncharacterized protein PFB0765w isoform X2 [Tribolium castaneum]